MEFTIYRIYCKDLSLKECYVGSTNNLKRRIQEHRKRCTNENNPKTHYRVYQYIRENGGWENFTFETLFEGEAPTLYERNQKEREYIEEFGASLNKVIPTRTLKEYCEEYRDKIQDYHKEYRDNNLDGIKKYRKEYYYKHKNTLREKMKSDITQCVCGVSHRTNDSARHRRSQHHRIYILSHNN